MYNLRTYRFCVNSVSSKRRGHFRDLLLHFVPKSKVHMLYIGGNKTAELQELFLSSSRWLIFGFGTFQFEIKYATKILFDKRLCFGGFGVILGYIRITLLYKCKIINDFVLIAQVNTYKIDSI